MNHTETSTFNFKLHLGRKEPITPKVFQDHVHVTRLLVLNAIITEFRNMGLNDLIGTDILVFQDAIMSGIWYKFSPANPYPPNPNMLEILISSHPISDNEKLLELFPYSEVVQMAVLLCTRVRRTMKDSNMQVNIQTLWISLEVFSITFHYFEKERFFKLSMGTL